MERNCRLASAAGPRFRCHLTDTKLRHLCSDSALDLWPPDHFELGLFASRKGPSELEATGQ